MKLSREIHEGGYLPRWYGVAWRRYDNETAVCYPVPLNLLVAVARALWRYLRTGYRIVPSNPREAYAQGFRDGQRALRKDGHK